MARVIGLSLPISMKDSIEACNFIRKKNVESAKKALDNVVKGEQPIPIKRFNKNRGHKKSIGPGKYPKKVSSEILKLIESVEANAQFKGLNTSNLSIKHISAQKGPKQWHHGRQRRRQMKRTHIEIVVEEKVEKKEERKAQGKSDGKKKVVKEGNKPDSKKSSMKENGKK